MTTFQVIIRKFWIYVEKPVWSFVVNSVFWLGRLNKIGVTSDFKESLKQMPLESFMNSFSWKADSLKDWTPWVLTLLYNSLSDDCDGAAALAKWWFKQNGIKADILNLYNLKEGHTICVTRDRTKMVSNGNVVNLNPATWEQGVMRYFNNEYEVIL